MTTDQNQINVFLSYAHEDEVWLKRLEVHLSLLQRQEIISTWHDRKIVPGTNWAEVIDQHLEQAAIVLLLVSADFLASDYCYEVEMKRTLERHASGRARVIPIVVRPADWKDAPFAHLQALPTNAKAISSWSDPDEAFVDIVAGIRKAIKDLLPQDRIAFSPIWNVPYHRNPYFTGRDELLDQLKQRLTPATQNNPIAIRSAALTQPQAIKGLGGIGKTQIAVEYAYRSRDQGHYVHTLWVNAASEDAIITSFVMIAELLPSLSAKNETDQRKLIKATKRWLEQCQQRWLLIFDNADDIALVQNYLPQQGTNGSILLTTRANAVGALAASIEVETMGLVEGTQLLLRRTQCFENASDEEFNQAGNIVVALDHFPLALDQAGAYIEETKCSFGAYLQMYHTHRKELLARRGGLKMIDYPASIMTTWSLSFQKVEQANPAAAELLRTCAFLAPDKIPEELIRDGAVYWSSLLQQAATDLFTFHQIIEELLKFSLMKRLTEDHALSIHRLVQAVQVDTMEPEVQRQWAERVVRAVDKVFPDYARDVATWPQCLRYLDQAQTCNVLIEHYKLPFIEAADLLNRTGLYLYEHGLYTVAEPLYLRSLSIDEQSLGPEDPDVARVLNNLALLYEKQGKYSEAEPLYQRALRIKEQGLGPEHPDVAYPLHNLANLYKDQGKYSEAELLYQRSIHLWEQNLGPEHSQVATPLNGLALLYQRQGKHSEAESLYQRALRIKEQSLGPEHPDVATPLNGLASLYGEQGKYREAEPLYQRALYIAEQNLGPMHPDVAYSLNGLASLYGEQGKYREAEPLYQRALQIREQSLGPEHPLTQQTLKNYATLVQEMRPSTQRSGWQRIRAFFSRSAPPRK